MNKKIVKAVEDKASKIPTFLYNKLVKSLESNKAKEAIIKQIIKDNPNFDKKVLNKLLSNKTTKEHQEIIALLLKPIKESKKK